MKINILRCVLLTGLMMMLASGAHAENARGDPWDKFNISIGGFTSRTKSSIQLNNTNTGVGVVVDLEDTLNVQSKFDTVRLDTLYRFGETNRHQIEFHYFESNRDGVRTLSNAVDIGNIHYPAGTTLNTGLDLAFYNVDYAYALLQDQRVRIAVSGGLHVTSVGLNINSEGFAVQEEESFTAPLPVIGLRLDVALAKNWKLKSAVSLFYLEFDEYKGGLADTYFGVEWNPFRHFGFGAGYNNVVYKVEASSTDSNGLGFNGKVDINITGLLIYAKYFF